MTNLIMLVGLIKNWNNNIRYAINIVDDPYTGKQMYSFADLSDNSVQNSF